MELIVDGGKRARVVESESGKGEGVIIELRDCAATVRVRLLKHEAVAMWSAIKELVRSS